MRKRTTACIFMLVMIIAGVFLGTYRSLSGLRAKTQQIFLDGVDGDGYSIQSDLEIILEQSYNLMTVSKNYFEESDGEMQNLLSARNALAAAAAPSEKYMANSKVYEAVTTLYFKLKGAPGLTETHAKLAAQYYTEVLSRNDTIKNDGYNEKAREYNEILKGFPAGIIGGILGIRPAELFG